MVLVLQVALTTPTAVPCGMRSMIALDWLLVVFVLRAFEQLVVFLELPFPFRNTSRPAFVPRKPSAEDARYMLLAELLSHFWPNCDCTEFGLFSRLLAELLKILERRGKCELRSLKFES